MPFRIIYSFDIVSMVNYRKAAPLLLVKFQGDNMGASARERTESKVLATKVTSDEAFAEGTKWSQRTFFYKNATESIRAGRPLAASIYYHKNGRGMVSIFSGIGGGFRARVVQVDK
ncbi:MAG TPA: hypothetical protein VEG61_05230, partial [Candidatus Dormibacteraeota bacterium]|nr:hypothetical protein [Candidatus Dormibacteraeota bacterium]